MNNNFFRQTPYTSPYTIDSNIPNSTKPISSVSTNIPISQYQYTDGIIQANINKKVKIYMSFPDSVEWRNQIFEGKIEAAGKDYLLIKDQNTNHYSLLRTIYIDFLEFEETINY